MRVPAARAARPRITLPARFGRSQGAVRRAGTVGAIPGTGRPPAGRRPAPGSPAARSPRPRRGCRARPTSPSASRTASRLTATGRSGDSRTTASRPTRARRAGLRPPRTSRTSPSRERRQHRPPLDADQREGGQRRGRHGYPAVIRRRHRSPAPLAVLVIKEGAAIRSGVPLPSLITTRSGGSGRPGAGGNLRACSPPTPPAFAPDDPLSGLVVGERPEPEVPDGWTTVDVQGRLAQPPRPVVAARRRAAGRTRCR